MTRGKKSEEKKNRINRIDDKTLEIDVGESGEKPN